MPSPAPTWYAPCDNDPCDCGADGAEATEDFLCHICHSNGCDECEDVGTNWKLDYNYPCVNCQEIFGVECLFCQDFNGCGQCASDYVRVYDEQEDIYYCELCTDLYGEGCIVCQQQGCGQCDDDHTLVTNDDGVKVCEDVAPEVSPTPKPTPTPECTVTSIDHCTVDNCVGQNPNCAGQQSWGCPNCDSGYFQISHDIACIACSSIDNCDQSSGCSDWTGCNSCEEGFTRHWDHDCAFYVCV